MYKTILKEKTYEEYILEETELKFENSAVKLFYRKDY